jgi:hypothetical protein
LDASHSIVNGGCVAIGLTAQILRRQIREHNFSVLAASGATLVFAVCGWAAFYGAAYWVTMFALTVVKAGDAALPGSFHFVVATIFGVLLAAALLDAWLFPQVRVVDERPALQTAGDIILFLPRLTVAVVLNFTAWARLPRDARPDAADLLDRLRTEKKIAVSTLPLDLQDDRTRDRILLVLQLINLVEIRPERGELWLRFSALAPTSLRGKLVSDNTDDELARMRRATVFKHKYALPSPKRELPGHHRDDL